MITKDFVVELHTNKVMEANVVFAVILGWDLNPMKFLESMPME